MPKYDVYLDDPNANPFSVRLMVPVFRGIEADCKDSVEKLFNDYKKTEEGQKFKDFTIKDIKFIEE